MSNVLTTRELAKYRQEIINQFTINPTTTGAEMKAVLDALDDTNKLSRHEHVIKNAKYTIALSGSYDIGGEIDSGVVTTAGTGYIVGETFPIIGGGSGADVTILTIGVSGEILTISYTLGSLYLNPTVDLSGSGDGAGVITLTATPIVTTVNQNDTLDDMLGEVYP